MNIQYFFTHRVMYRDEIFRAKDYSNTQDPSSDLKHVHKLLYWSKTTSRIWKRIAFAFGVVQILFVLSFVFSSSARSFLVYLALPFVFLFVFSVSQFITWLLQSYEYKIIMYDLVKSDLDSSVRVAVSDKGFGIIEVYYKNTKIFEGTEEQIEKANVSDIISKLYMTDILPE